MGAPRACGRKGPALRGRTTLRPAPWPCLARLRARRPVHGSQARLFRRHIKQPARAADDAVLAFGGLNWMANLQCVPPGSWELEHAAHHSSTRLVLCHGVWQPGRASTQQPGRSTPAKRPPRVLPGGCGGAGGLCWLPGCGPHSSCHWSEDRCQGGGGSSGRAELEEPRRRAGQQCAGREGTTWRLGHESEREVRSKSPMTGRPRDETSLAQRCRLPCKLRSVCRRLLPPHVPAPPACCAGQGGLRPNGVR